MLHYYKRCKFCGKVYSYQASGYGCLEPTNDENYCPECKSIILDALEKQVPKERRLVPSPKEVEKFSDELLTKIEQIKSEYHDKDKGHFRMATFCSLYYDNIEIYKINGIKYYVAYDKIDDIHYFIDYEYCHFTKKYEEPYKYYGDENSYIKGINMAKQLSKISPHEFKPLPLENPLGYLWYFNVFDIKSERE
ncbi:MAG: hypothetical protein K2M17_00130 [Bacilli bacterium]|nr:hypothetical protein [Bacilli bacterium]